MALLLALLAFAPLDSGRDLTKRFYASDTASIWAQMTPQMQGALGSAAALAQFRVQAGAQLGDEVSIVEEKVEPMQGFQVYRRMAKFSRVPMTIEVRWALDEGGKIAGFFIKPAEGKPGEAKAEAPTKHLDYQTKTKLALPFEGDWTVVWGGKTVAQNYHAATRDQRFAYDILVVKDGATHSGPKLEEYYAFGKLLSAPAAGTVVEAVDGLPDQAPGAMDPAHAMGNHVVLDHGNGEYSFLCHFKQGSLKVKAGDKVKAGQPLGLCGNSGNTSEPHLHYHLQDAPKPFDGDGLPALFEGYTADGKPVERGMPLKGQVIRRK